MCKPYDGPWTLRSLLFVPGHIDKMVRNAASTHADCVVLDLEDAVPQDQKTVGRTKIRDVLDVGIYRKKTVFCRINPIDTGLTLRDLEGVACEALHGFVYPMAYTADDIKKFDAQLSLIDVHLNLEKGHFSIIVLIETPMAVLNAYELAISSQRVIALLFGCEDFLAGMEARYGEMDMGLHTPRAIIAMAARAAGVEAIDTPYVRVHDLQGLKVFALRARDLGMSGMLVMTPNQIPVAHEVYTPSKQDVQDAEKTVVEAETVGREGRGIAVIDGKFVSPPNSQSSQEASCPLSISTEPAGVLDACRDREAG